MALLVSVNWGSNLENALSKATQDKTLVVLYFSGSDWCAPCIQLKKEVLESEPFMKYAAGNLELVRADFPRQKKNQLSKQQLAYNEGLAEKYNPKGRFPLTLLLSADGKVLEEWDGYPKGLNADKMLERIKSHRQ
jgi:thioredoxin-related protein